MAGQNPRKLTLKHQTYIVKPKLGAMCFTRQKLRAAVADSRAASITAEGTSHQTSRMPQADISKGQ